MVQGSLRSSLACADLFYQSEDALFRSEAEFLTWNLSCYLAEELQRKFHPLVVPQRGEGTGEQVRYGIEPCHIFDGILLSMAQEKDSL